MNALAPLAVFGRALDTALGSAGSSLARSVVELASARDALEAAFSAAASGLGAALDLVASDPSAALVATFFAGSAAGTVSTLFVLALGWAVVRRLRR